MLLLTRRSGESVVIMAGDKRIVVQIVAVRGNQIRIGFEAPKDVHILRNELEGVASKKKDQRLPVCSRCLSPEHHVSDCDVVS